MKVAVGSKNPAKVKAVERIASEFGMSVIAEPVPSGVSSQPLTDIETKQGAINRAKNVQQSTQSEIGIGLEGGVMQMEDQWFVCNWGALVDDNGFTVVCSGSRFLLPHSISQELGHGKELGDVMDAYMNREDVRKKEGAIGIFTNGFVTRSDLYEHIVKVLFGQYSYLKNRF